MLQNALSTKTESALADLVENYSSAERIRTDEDALNAASRIVVALRKGAAHRDATGELPFEEIEQFSTSGLWAITVPKEFDGPDLSVVTVCKVFEIISEADPSIGQIPQNHFTTVDDIRMEGSELQKQFFFDRILRGDRIGSAFSEARGKNVRDIRTTITPTGDDSFVVNGEKFYCTGAIFAHWLPVLTRDLEGREILAMCNRSAPGITIENDWSSFGQRTTSSGTVKIDNVHVTSDQLFYTFRSYERPTNSGAFAQIMHAAVDAGIAKAAIQETIDFVKNSSRAWIDSGVEKASDDPLTIGQIGDLEYRLHAAEALLERAGLILDESYSDMTSEKCAAASIAVAEAKIATTEIAILAANKLFELAGTKSTLSGCNLDRHWRNARVHTLHDPVRWKYEAVGNYYLNGKSPNRHNWI